VEIREWVEEKGSEIRTIGGDFNAWTGKQGGRVGWRRRGREKIEGWKGEQGREIFSRSAGGSGWFIFNGEGPVSTHPDSTHLLTSPDA